MRLTDPGGSGVTATAGTTEAVARGAKNVPKRRGAGSGQFVVDKIMSIREREQYFASGRFG